MAGAGQILLAQADKTQANAIAEALPRGLYGKAAGWLLRAQSLSDSPAWPAHRPAKRWRPWSVLPARRRAEQRGCPYCIA